MRLLVLGGGFAVAWTLVYPSLPGALGLLVAALVSAAALGIETLLTARLRRRDLRQVALWRVLATDRLFARPGESYVEQRQLEREREKERLRGGGEPET
jgi:hypothetical protein